VRNLIVEAQERGDVHESLDAGLVANAIFGTLNWIYTWYRPGGSAGPENLGQLYAELVVNGITGARMPEPEPARNSKRPRRVKSAKAG
jgi:hypothetical protein